MNNKINFKSRYSQLLIHSLVWLFFLSFPFLFFNDDITFSRLTEHLFRSLLLVVLFYTNTQLLIPKILSKNKIGLYILSVFVVIAIYLLVCSLSEIVQQYIFDLPRFHRYFFHFPRAFFAALFIFGLSTSYKMTIEWLRSERQKKELETEKLSSELAFLKSQINPHFLFNTLNNVYSLAFKKSDDTPEAILKLSKLMRYMLYESNEKQVFLSKEIDYLHNFIDLQKLRLSEKVEINFIVEGDVEGRLIEPMLLIPFVENAFKHGISYVDYPAISIHLKLNESDLVFKVENTISNTYSPEMTDSGIGLANVKRRLNLLYPDKHKLHIKDSINEYKVLLKICLEKC
jgi:two-component system LytT family sensor kinase